MSTSAKDGIIYATISTKRTPSSQEASILCHAMNDSVVCSSMEGLAPRILDKIPTESANKTSYCYEKVLFNLVIDENVVYMCVTDESLGRRIPFEFLEKIKSQFKATFATSWHRIRSMEERECKSFVPSLKRQMKAALEEDKFLKTQEDLEVSKGYVQHSIETLLARGEKIDILVQRADELQGESRTFQRHARDLQCEMLKRRILWIGGVLVLLTILILIILMIACNPNFKKCK